MYRRAFFACEISVAVDALREHREADRPDATGCQGYSSEGERRYMANDKELERNCEKIGK